MEGIESVCVCVCVYRERFILRNWLMQLQRLASPKSAGLAGRLDTLRKASVVDQV